MTNDRDWWDEFKELIGWIFVFVIWLLTPRQ